MVLAAGLWQVGEMPQLDSNLLLGLLWLLPGWLGLRSAAIAPAGERATWVLVGLVCVAAGMDKWLDYQSLLYEAAKSVVGILDPENHWRGDTAYLRLLVLGGGVLLGLGGLLLWMRLDRGRDGYRLCAVAGVGVLVAFLGLRHVPAAKVWLASPPILPAESLLQAAAWLMVMGGLLGSRRALRERA